MMVRSAGIITVGSEITLGLRLDTNTADVARALTPYGFAVTEAVSVADDLDAAARAIGRLAAACDLVVVTGGLGPTHDDITREAAAQALRHALVRNPRLERLLEPVRQRHRSCEAADRVFRQADVLEGAEVLDPTTGTAPGQVLTTGSSTVVLLPGPPSEMLPMLQQVLSRYETLAAVPVELGVFGITESDAQAAVEPVLPGHGVGFTVLSRPDDVRVILTDEGAGAQLLADTASAACDRLGDSCYSRDGATLTEVVMRLAQAAGVTIATAESCTGGLVAKRLTDPSGASAVFLGGAVTYADEAKAAALGVDSAAIGSYGAVSAEVARQMAEGARVRFGSDLAVSITGIAGPSGGSADKPVGTVWFGVSYRSGLAVGDSPVTFRRLFRGTRYAIRQRAAATALDALRRVLAGAEVS